MPWGKFCERRTKQLMTKVWGSWKHDAFENYSIWSKVILVIMMITPKLGTQQIPQGSQPYPNCNWETMNNFCSLIDCKEPNPITKFGVSTWLWWHHCSGILQSLKMKSWKTVLTSSACDARGPWTKGPSGTPEEKQGLTAWLTVP